MELGGDEGEEEGFGVKGGHGVGLEGFEGEDEELAAGGERSHDLHESADMVQRQDAATIHLLDFKVPLKPSDRGH
jgi:hypothetical protein